MVDRLPFDFVGRGLFGRGILRQQAKKGSGHDLAEWFSG